MYVELHARSAFSFLEGGSTPEDLIARAAELDLPAIALLDRNGLYGAPRFHNAAKKAGIRAHIGAEVVATDGHRYALLAESQEGYRNLCRLLTRANLRASKGEAQARPDEIREFSRGLVCLLPTRVTADRDIDLSPWRDAFRGSLYAEVQRHYDRQEEARNHLVIARARAERIPLLATNGVAYATPDKRELTDALTCLRHKVRLSNAGRLLDRNAERHLKSARDMSRLFADLPEAVAASADLSARLAYSMDDLGYRFPPYPTPGETMDSFLRKRTDEGARRRFQPYTDRARRQIERELKLIEKLGLAGYFLIVWDIVEFCRRSGILVQGRGSAANSAVCYSLGITAVDPIAMELLFERFLSEERGEWPDIDLDLPSGDQRERAIQYVYERYGQLGAAMTANVITYRGKSAAREMGKVLGFEEHECARLSSTMSAWEWTDPEETQRGKFRDAGLDPDHPRIKKLFELFVAVHDLPRHLGQHSGGMVICQGSLDSVVPLEPASMPGRVVVTWDKEDCADMGIIKVDLLGLGMMAVLEESIVMIREAYGDEVDLAHLPQDDPKVYSALQRADTVGMFQVESRAQMSCLPRLKPAKFYDIVVQVALIRPGPIVGKMVHPYLSRRQGREPVECLHPSLEPVLRRTLGVPLFQEQLLRMAMIAANFTGGEAEELRRAMGFKRSMLRMKEIEARLRAGMTANGIASETQDTIVLAITSFALYGFPESHAASFALIAYASAWLKVHYPAAFTASLLNCQPMGFYHPATLVKDAQRHGVRVLPVDVAISGARCSVEGRELRLGLNYVRGMNKATAEAIAFRRPYTDVDDLVRRVPELKRDELRVLASIGALNTLERGHRRDLLWRAESAARRPGELIEQASEPEPPSPLRIMTPDERLIADYAGTSMTVGRHPMAHRRASLDKLGVMRSIDLRGRRDGEWVRVAGCVIVRQRPGTAKGFVFLSLEDETGISNIIVEPDEFKRDRWTYTGDPYLLIEGKLQNQDGVVSVKARAVRALGAGAAAPAHNFH